jgi:Omp85 superfamily domain
VSRALWALPLCALLALVTEPAPANAQETDRRTVETVPGAEYAAGRFRRFFLGDHYRDLWTVPIEVAYLDLREFAGGLMPLSAHAGSQTTSLRFAGADGRTYQFRRVFKTPTAGLQPDLQGTVVADILQDGASASHPAGTVIVSPLLEAVGVLHADPRLAVLPDDPALGEFRADFAGMLGTIEERPNEAEDGVGGFGAAIRVIGPDRLFERLDEGPEDQVDVGSFLTARLIDILIGDRDRHRDNWRWALMDESGPVRFWRPISRDHDEAFVKLDGLLLHLATRYYPQLVSFSPEYASTHNLNWHAREVDRRFLAGVDRPTWDSTTAWVQSRLTDEVIEGAVARMPAAMFEIDGAELGRALRRRRDDLGEEVDRYYRMLAGEVEIHATNAAEYAEIDRVDDRFLTVAIRGDGAAEPYFFRRFDALETGEVRLSMWGGRDRVVVRGQGDPPIEIRVVGGRGRDELLDSSRVGHVRFYDSGDETTAILGPGSSVDDRPFEEWIGSDLDRYPPREWGSWSRPIPLLSAGPHFGLLWGAGVIHTRYGFRKTPYAWEFRLTGGLATGDGWGRIELDTDIRFENSSVRLEVKGAASGIDLLRYHGLGNDTPGGGAPRFFQVEVNELWLQPRVVVPLSDNTALSVGPSTRRTSTDTDRRLGFFDSVADTLVGAGVFGWVGAGVEFEIDTRDAAVATTRGVLFSAAARAVPPLWDVTDAFGAVSGEARAFFSIPDTRIEPTLALRAGGEKLFGAFPFQEAAFLGGRKRIRGWSSDRFAGDASLYASAEIRLRLGRLRVMLPADVGVFALFDAGRVFVDGASPGGVHTGVGGGIWTAFVDRSNTFTLSVAHSAEGTALYAGLGFAY